MRRTQCAGGEDELDCQPVGCRDDQFACADGACIPAVGRCDGQADCQDRSDELECPGVGCLDGQIECGDGSCVDPELICDGQNDCRDGADEVDCPEPICAGDAECPVGQVCENGSCAVCECPAVFEPVCGVDGNTYDSACTARCARVEVAALGECAPVVECPDQDTFDIAFCAILACDGIEIDQEGCQRPEQCDDVCPCADGTRPCAEDGRCVAACDNNRDCADGRDEAQFLGL